MSGDMSSQAKPAETSARKQEILQTAIEIIAEQGYAKLSMRALARASDMKLGAFQYHFPRWRDLLSELTAHIVQEYLRALEELEAGSEPLGLRESVEFLLDDAPGAALHMDKLIPQLWAMAKVEPVMEELLNEIYGEYHRRLEKLLKRAGSPKPRVEAIALMSWIEGTVPFVGRGGRWGRDAKAVHDFILDYIDSNYGDQS